MATTLIFLLSGEGRLLLGAVFGQDRLRNIAGLKSGAPVRVAGMEVGRSATSTSSATRWRSRWRSVEEHQPRITTESRAVLGSVSLLGEGAVDITPVEPGHADSRVGLYSDGPDGADDRRSRREATEGIEEATDLLQDIRAGRGTIGKLFTDEARLPRLQRARSVG